MKLSTADISNLSGIIETCAIGSIDSVIIEDGVVRGINDARTFVIISDVAVPKLTQKLGLSRLSSLKQRLGLFASDSSMSIDAKESERGEISSLELLAGKSKAQFRCTSTQLIKAPKSVNDPEAFSLGIEGAELQLILNAIKVMGGKTIQLIIKKDSSVSVVVNDATNDAFSTVLSLPAESISGEEHDSVIHYYHADIFSAALRSASGSQNSDVGFTIAETGTLRLEVNGRQVVVMSKINEDSNED